LRPWPLVRELLSYWLPPFLGVTAILVFSGDLGASPRTLNLVRLLLSWVPYLRPADLEVINTALRKGGYVLSYGVLFFLWFRAFRGHRGYGRGLALLCSLAWCLAVAAMDEGHQFLVASRTGSLRDVSLDLAGSTLGAVLTLGCWSPRLRASWGE